MTGNRTHTVRFLTALLAVTISFAVNKELRHNYSEQLSRRERTDYLGHFYTVATSNVDIGISLYQANINHSAFDGI